MFEWVMPGQPRRLNISSRTSGVNGAKLRECGAYLARDRFSGLFSITLAITSVLAKAVAASPLKRATESWAFADRPKTGRLACPSGIPDESGSVKAGCERVSFITLYFPFCSAVHLLIRLSS